MAKASSNGDQVFKHVEIPIDCFSQGLSQHTSVIPVAFQSRGLIQRPGPLGQESIFSSDLQSPQVDLIPE